jgi:sulfur carrier protein ThiS adenylyltransferase
MNDFETGLLRYFSRDQLTRIRRVHVGIAGAGGLGSNCAAALVRCGFRRFTIVDHDAVEPSNLNRQFYFLDQLGLPKVAALADNLRRINPDIAVTARRERVTPENAASLFADCDAVIEAFDDAGAKALLAETCARGGRLYIAASGIAGWGDSDGIVLRQVHETFYLVGDGVSAVSPRRPPCAPRVMVAAAKEADCLLARVLGPSGEEPQVPKIK